MYVLGIETSCDETSVSVVKDGKKVLSNAVISSLAHHSKYGGVVPEIASRMQLESIAPVAQKAIDDSGLKLNKIKLVCVTVTPGLLGSLVVGVSFAKSLALALGVPLLGVNHVHSHLYANFLDSPGVKLPFIALVVSGGHTNLYLVKDFDRIDLLGSTQDDACGEAFDKVAKILGLGYPGGPLIERLSEKGDPKKIKFNCSGDKDGLSFSFSGIKTAVLYYVRGRKSLDYKLKCDICASFQAAAIDALTNKSFLACERHKINRLVIGGGVAANSALRQAFFRRGRLQDITCYFPQRYFCADNAAMVAGFGYRIFKKDKAGNLYLNVLN